MFEKLQRKWKVGSMQLVLVLFTFAIGGSLTGMAARKVMALIPVEQPVVWTILYIITLTLLWPLMVIIVSIPFGQFAFFRNYLARMAARLKRKEMKERSFPTQTINVSIFASGAGSNAKKIIEHFRNHPTIVISLVVSNKPDAGVLEIASAYNIPTLIIEKERFFRGDTYLPVLEEKGIGFIVLAGFLWKIPAALIAAYPGHIINIHPALLPKYGGKGMYGRFVHEAVLAAGDKETGITIHYVDEQYDHGGTIFQAVCQVDETDNADSLAQKVHALEHAHFPRIVEQTILQKADSTSSR